MAKWQTRLKAALNSKGLENMKRASLDAGLNETAVQQIVTKGKDPQASTLIKLAAAHHLDLNEILLGVPGVPNNDGPRIHQAPVVGYVQAGLWYDEGHSPQIDFDPVPAVAGRYGNLEQSAYRVVGHSMNLARLEDGDFAITVPYWQVRVAPQDGDIVVVERRRDSSEIERTVKLIVVFPDRIELTARSTDPSFSEPLVVPRAANPDDFGLVEIVALVIGRHTAF